MSNIGQYLRPEDEAWQMLTIDGFGEFAVKAPTPDAAWLKLSYYCQEDGRQADHSIPGFDPEKQLDFFLSAETLDPEATTHHNKVHYATSIVLKRYIEYNPTPIRRYPQFGALLLKEQQHSNNVVSWDEYFKKPRTYPNVA